MGDVAKAEWAKKGKSLKALAQRWLLLLKGDDDGVGLKKEWRRVDASGNGTVSQSEVLTWLCTAHADVNDTQVVQYAFNVALALQAQEEKRKQDDHASSSS